MSFCVFWYLISSQASCALWNRHVSQRDKGLMQTGLGQRSELGWVGVEGRGGGQGGGGGGGRLLWKQPQGQTEHDQRPSDALQTQLEEREKKIPQKEKSLKKGAKTRQSISTRTKNKNVFKVKPWEQRGPWLQPDKSRQADEEQSSGARERTAAEDKGSAYPALLSFVCWFHFFFPDWVKPMAAVCQV